MQSISRLFGAFTNLAASVNALAGVIDQAAARLRLQLAGETEPPEVLEHVAGEVPAPAPAETGKGRRRS